MQKYVIALYIRLSLEDYKYDSIIHPYLLLLTAYERAPFRTVTIIRPTQMPVQCVVSVQIRVTLPAGACPPRERSGSR